MQNYYISKRLSNNTAQQNPNFSVLQGSVSAGSPTSSSATNEEKTEKRKTKILNSKENCRICI